MVEPKWPLPEQKFSINNCFDCCPVFPRTTDIIKIKLNNIHKCYIKVDLILFYHFWIIIIDSRFWSSCILSTTISVNL